MKQKLFNVLIYHNSCENGKLLRNHRNLISTVYNAFKDVLVQVVSKDVTSTVHAVFSTYPDEGALSNFLSHLLSPEDVHMAQVRHTSGVDIAFCGLAGKMELCH